MFIILSHWGVTASKFNLSWLMQCPFVYYLESFLGFGESYTFWETLLSFRGLEGGGHWQYHCLSNDSLFSSFGEIIWIECLKPVNNPHPGKSRTIAFLPPWALVLVASRAQDDASFHHVLKVAFSLKKWWRRLGTQMTGRHFFWSQMLHILPLTLQRLQRQLDFGEFEVFEVVIECVGMLFRAGTGGWS